MEHIETIIIGGGQAGLSTSYYLTQHARQHIVLERYSQPTPVWRNERWDSFTLVTPNLAFNIPGADLSDKDPNSFMTLEDVITFFEDYIEHYNLPVKYNSNVISVEPSGEEGYLIYTAEKKYFANNVVIATGLYQKPRIPLAMDIPSEIFQIHSSQYRNPESIPEGAVLIIGSAQSGCQIAEELNEYGIKIFLSTSKAGRAQRRYRGKDIIDWLNTIGFFNLTFDQLPPGTPKFYGIPHLSGKRGGHTINLHQFARDGITLLGRLRGIRGTRVSIAPDLTENLEFADQFDSHALNEIDAYIQANKLDLPAEKVPVLRDGFSQPIIEELDLKTSGIKTIIWANGYSFDYSFVKVPVRDRDGYPIQTSGVTNYKGLSFVGLPWMPTEKSGFLLGVGDHARYVAGHIIEMQDKKHAESIARM